MQRDLLGVHTSAGPFDVAGQAAAIEQALFLRGFLACVEPVPIGKLRGTLQHVRECTAVVNFTNCILVWQLRRLDVVDLANLARVHPDLPRGRIHQALDNKHGFRPPGAPIRSGRRGVRQHGLDIEVNQRKIVNAGRNKRSKHQRNDHARTGEISAGTAK